MAASSSATNMLPVGIVTSRALHGRGVVGDAVAAVDGREDAEDRPPRLRFTLDDAAVVAHNLGYQCKSEATAALLGGDERIEQMRHQVFRHAGAVVLDAEF